MSGFGLPGRCCRLQETASRVPVSDTPTSEIEVMEINRREMQCKGLGEVTRTFGREEGRGRYTRLKGRGKVIKTFNDVHRGCFLVIFFISMFLSIPSPCLQFRSGWLQKYDH